MRPVWAEVDLGAIAQNVRTLRALAEPASFCAVVKADGYGHGSVPCAQAALAGGADVLAVALVAEGVDLREAGIDTVVMVLSQASPDEIDQLVAADLDATVYTASGVRGLARAAAAAGRSSGRPVRVHLKIDTGMHRVGAQPHEAVGLARSIDAEPGLELRSVFTHCAVADEPGNDFTTIQLERFRAVIHEIEASGVTVPCTHAANTAAAIDHPGARLGLVRCGIGIYGIDPAPALAGRVDLVPALSLRARVSHVKRVAAGEGISYGLRYRPPVEATIATVPLGYADGLPRRLGALGGTVLVGGRSRPIAGSVTMDQILVDCGDDSVEVGDEVVLLGAQGDASITAADWADRLDTIAYEIVCGISPRVPRRYLEVESMNARNIAALLAGIGIGIAGAGLYRSTHPRDAKGPLSPDPGKARRPIPDELFDLPDDVIHHSIDTHDGGTIHAIEKGEGRPLVLLHGITLRSDVWAPQFHQLTDRYRVIAVDLRGHGTSEVGADGLGIHRLAQDLATLLTELDLHDVVLVGHSMGGMTVMQFCGLHADVLDERVDGLVFLATASHESYGPLIDNTVRAVVARGQAVVEGGRELPPASQAGLKSVRLAFGDKPSKKAVDIVAEMVTSIHPTVAVPSFASILEHDARDALRATHTPSLVVVGTRDILTPVWAGRQLARALPVAEFVVLPRAGHQLMQERPDEVAELIDAFVAKIDGIEPSVAAAVADLDGPVDADQVEAAGDHV